eukprot:186512_1
MEYTNNLRNISSMCMAPPNMRSNAPIPNTPLPNTPIPNALSVPPIYDNKNNNNNTKMKMKVKVMQHQLVHLKIMIFQCVLMVYGGSGYSGYIKEGEDIDEDEDMNEDDAYGGSGYDGYYRN